MKNLIFIIIAIIIGAVYYQDNDSAAGFIAPAAAAGQRSGSGIMKYEFTELFEQNRVFSKLAKNNYYTVIEGYIDTCTICKKLESDFPEFLKQRKDIIIQKVHFPEGGVSQSFSGSTQEEMMQQIDDYYERLGRYSFNHVVKTDAEYRLSVCGTPHVEIYGPDKKLIATDRCGEKNIKAGFNFLKNWIKSEKQGY